MADHWTCYECNGPCPDSQTYCDKCGGSSRGRPEKD